MGMALFESSGTFKPGDYGLSTGDTIQIVAVGGGGGGGGASAGYGNNGGTYSRTVGAAGGISSFGNIVTAIGGSGGDNGTQGGGAGTGGIGATYTSSASDTVYGGAGGGGWYPGVANCMVSAVHSLPDNMPIYAFDSMAGVAYTGGRTSRGAGGRACDGRYMGVGANRGGGNGGGGGAGYGAGGGGGAAIAFNPNYGGGKAGAGGGYSGQLKVITYTLKSTDTSFAVTVGAGGSGGAGNAAGGNGAPGCVAVFW